MMKILIPASLFFLAAACSPSHKIDSMINASVVGNLEKTLSSDDMRGRASFSPDIERAADFIEVQFRAAGLLTWNGGSSYRQPFILVKTSPVSSTAVIDGQTLPEGKLLCVSSSADLSIDENSGFEKVHIRPGGNAGTEAMHLLRDKKNYLVLVDTSYAAAFPRFARFARQQFKSSNSVVFVLATGEPSHYSIHVTQKITESKLANVVGVLPGKSKKNEYVIFSGHYDHLGVGKPDSKGDSIFNGANDDASGSTAVMMLANYFARLKNNERTLIFATFTAEEIGGFGSTYFSQQYDPATVMAMFNIEMIGTESKWGVNSAYITGYEKTDMGKILEKNLAGSGFTFYPDPYPQQQLFYRSDNATLARQGVPAHTISTSKMDSEKFYHTQGDEIGTLDMKNMARIIQSIAISSRTIIDGKDSPSRVDVSQLK